MVVALTTHLMLKFFSRICFSTLNKRFSLDKWAYYCSVLYLDGKTAVFFKPLFPGHFSYEWFASGLSVVNKLKANRNLETKEKRCSTCNFCCCLVLFCFVFGLHVYCACYVVLLGRKSFCQAEESHSQCESTYFLSSQGECFYRALLSRVESFFFSS